VSQNQSSLAHPSLHNCSLRLYRSIATPNVWISSAKSMKQNTGKESPTAAKACLRGDPTGRSDLASDLFPMCQVQSH
jgi:hypothetical protein